MYSCPSCRKPLQHPPDAAPCPHCGAQYMPTLMAAGSVPPPMAPPPGMAPPPPPMGYMPPPAPVSGGGGGVPWKWIFVGCGCFATAILVLCGGMGLWGYLFARDIEMTTKSIQNSPRVQEEVGTPVHVTPGRSQTQNPDQSVTQTWTASGPKGRVDIEVTVKMVSMKLKITDVTMITRDGDRVPLGGP